MPRFGIYKPLVQLTPYLLIPGILDVTGIFTTDTGMYNA